MAERILITRPEAIERGLSRYFTGKPCKHGHVAERLTKWCLCVQCHNERAAQYYRQQKDAGKDVNVRSRRWQRKNREKCKRKYEEWRCKNLAYNNERCKKWIRKNLPWRRAYEALLRARLKQATPSWVNKKELVAVYRNCPEGYHVDHIVPLTHPLVCGLHVPWNLQYLTPQENLRKHNRWP